MSDFLSGVLKFATNMVKSGAKNAAARNRTTIERINIGGEPLSYWERKWKYIGSLETVNLSLYNKDTGVYRLKIGSEIKYIGRAIEQNNGGFRKRLSDYRRKSDSARKHGSGQKINENLGNIEVDIIIVNEAETTKKLEKALIMKYAPEWNVEFLGL